MRPLKAFGVLVVLLVVSAGMAEFATPRVAEARGRISGGFPDDHSGQDMSAKSITLSAGSGTSAVVIPNGARLCLNGSTCTHTMSATSGSETIIGAGSAAINLQTSGFIYNSVGNFLIQDTVQINNTTSAGTITLSAGTGTATAFSGARCVCTDTTANASVKCAVSGSTLTATGTTTDVIAYHCF